MFILRGKIRQNLRKYYNTAKANIYIYIYIYIYIKEEKRDKLLQVFFSSKDHNYKL